MAPARNAHHRAPSSKCRVIAAFLIVPVVPTFLYVLLIMTGHALGGSMSLSEAWAGLFFGTFLLSFFSYPCVWLFGIPAWLIMSRLRLVSLPAVLVAGAVLGAASGIAISGIATGDWPWNSGYWRILPAVVFFAPFGIVTALAFWWIALSKNENLSTPMANNSDGENISLSHTSAPAEQKNTFIPVNTTSNHSP